MRSLEHDRSFPLRFGKEIKTVSKIGVDGFTPFHQQIIEQSSYQNRTLALPDPRWRVAYLGAGEEKAVFCICDHDDHVFALEVIDEKSYLDGRFVGGQYFRETRALALGNVKLDPQSLIGLTFTGRIKAREYVYGYEWARFQYDPRRQSWFDTILTDWLRLFLNPQFSEYQTRFRDVHDRNVMFEIRSRGARGIPVIARDWAGKMRAVRVGLQPIDVR